ncbi:IclR family transcriptional regulator [Leucobacter sp. wl10]|uniref:IclR family transcriptional regulator n=1 Tax=Leucobacter sp. wl10 TaxID=2304677 RepID=UPI000E5C4F44|nr:IclR family transcriptional regulator [Leucobacter sp. wl10]RGE18528.1 IclR family transcriptional regulator [Leucobacter sp. wl10]
MVRADANVKSARVGTVSPSVGMALSVLDALAEAHRDLSATEINSALALPKSTLHRILNSLELEDAVQRHPVTRRYSLGSRVSKYAPQLGSSQLVTDFMELATDFVAQYDETIQLCTYSQGVVTFIAFVESTQPVRLSCEIGRQRAAHATASGKALLAHSEAETVRAFLEEGELFPMTGSTITDPEVLLTQLELVRQQGFATESQESARNLSCIAAPIRDRSGIAIAAVTLCLPTRSIQQEDLDRLVGPLLRIADQLDST